MSSEFLLFVGRFHPLLVHLPIGLLVLVAMLEGLAFFPRLRHANGLNRLILALAAPLAGVTALCGWLLSGEGGYETHLLAWHQWTGLGTAAACLLTALLCRFARPAWYRAALGLNLVALVVASHYGGSLTHGSDYLLQYAPAPLQRLARGRRAHPPAAALSAQGLDQPAFVGGVQPFIERRCVACHGPEKAKGGLRADTLAGLLKGGDNGPAILPGKPGESLALKRMLLPRENDEHMPPEGKPQPSPEELAFFQRWIEAGAAPTNR